MDAPLLSPPLLPSSTPFLSLLSFYLLLRLLLIFPLSTSTAIVSFPNITRICLLWFSFAIFSSSNFSLPPRVLSSLLPSFLPPIHFSTPTAVTSFPFITGLFFFYPVLHAFLPFTLPISFFIPSLLSPFFFLLHLLSILRPSFTSSSSFPSFLSSSFTSTSFFLYSSSSSSHHFIHFL